MSDLSRLLIQEAGLPCSEDEIATLAEGRVQMRDWALNLDRMLSALPTFPPGWHLHAEPQWALEPAQVREWNDQPPTEERAG